MLVKAVTETVYARLTSSTIPGVTHIEKGILPEGRIPASYGQQFLCVSPEQVYDVTGDTSGTIRRRQVRFIVTLVKRIRNYPNDRFGEVAYTEQNSMVETLDTVVDVIENYLTFTTLRSALISAGVSYGLSGTFTFATGTVDPIHLYPSFFLAASETGDDSTDKIAGYRMPYYFTSPIFTKSVGSVGDSNCTPVITATI